MRKLLSVVVLLYVVPTPGQSLTLYVSDGDLGINYLPEVPSAKEMEANGVNISEMNMLLLKKIEELTLHVSKQNEEMNKMNQKLLEKKN